MDALHPQPKAIEFAAKVIKKGGLVAFPTETVYGLGANALDPAATRKIFEAKHRPADNPLIVHIAQLRQLKTLTKMVPERVQDKLARKLWPGPVTFLLFKSQLVPDVVSGNTDKVAIRMPAHPVALALIRKAGVPIAAPSANTSTRPSPTKATHVLEDLKGRIDVILDGGDAFFGVESTIIDCTSNPYTLLRPGAFTLEELRKQLGGEKIRVPETVRQAKQTKVALVPGMKYRHYAPKKPLYLIKRENLAESPELFQDPQIGVLCSQELYQQHYNGKTPKNVIVLGSEEDLYGVAKNLFDSLRKLDTLNVKFGIIQSFAEKGIGFAIMNRIKKAASPPGTRRN